jgi:hypothetical protein
MKKEYEQYIKQSITTIIMMMIIIGAIFLIKETVKSVNDHKKEIINQAKQETVNETVAFANKITCDQTLTIGERNFIAVECIK